MDRRIVLKGAAMTALAATAAGGARASADHDATTYFKALYLVKRKPGMSFEDFRDHQVNVHMPLAQALPGLRYYVLDFYPPVDGEDQPFDGSAAVYFDSKEAHDAALASPEGQAALADLPNYQDMDAFLGLFGREAFHGEIGEG